MLCYREKNAGVTRRPYERALRAATTRQQDYVTPYEKDLGNIIDVDAIRSADIKMGADPLGGASLPYWEPIRDIHKLNITVVNPKLDPTFSFMPGGPRWQNPHGLLESLRDGQPGASQE